MEMSFVTVYPHSRNKWVYLNHATLFSRCQKVNNLTETRCELQSNEKTVPPSPKRIADYITDQILIKYITNSSYMKAKPILFGITGCPGSGKSTVAGIVTENLNQRTEAVCLPMDGFHYYRKELDLMEDPELAHARRGAPFTFNAEKFVSLLKSIKNQSSFDERNSLYWPSFDHAVKDPEENAIEVGRGCEVCILEGNYLLLEEGDWWPQVKTICDEIWYLDVSSMDVCMERVIHRHVNEMKLSKIDAIKRVDTNDRINAGIIENTKDRADFMLTQELFL
mmetsp:Transcript_8735/g.15772  ORF Transcript_8735/g.15772 Transcript_8735/m.15772 type:complete len:280 (-) Transcript_8735:381-1220(-)